MINSDAIHIMHSILDTNYFSERMHGIKTKKIPEDSNYTVYITFKSKSVLSYTFDRSNFDRNGNSKKIDIKIQDNDNI